MNFNKYETSVIEYGKSLELQKYYLFKWGEKKDALSLNRIKDIYLWVACKRHTMEYERNQLYDAIMEQK